MKTRSTWVFLGTSVLAGSLSVGSSLGGCRGNVDTFAMTSASSSSSSGAPTTSGTGGNANIPTVTIEQMTDQSVSTAIGPGTVVQLKGAVAMSIKFLASKSKSGSCLWGVFLSAPGLTTTGPNTGILALSEGTPTMELDGGTTAYCPTLQNGQAAGDAFPDDIQPGDVVDVVGQTDAYVPSLCSAADAGLGATFIPSIQLAKITVVTKTGTAPVPAPYTLSASDLATLAAGVDTTWFNNWGSVLVRADNVTAGPATEGLTDAYGHMLLEEGVNGIEVGDALYYVGAIKYRDTCYGGPRYSTQPPIKFQSITGFVYLDYCNWSLAPRDKCKDLSPPSVDCQAATDAGPNESPAAICYHEPTDFIDVTDGG